MQHTLKSHTSTLLKMKIHPLTLILPWIKATPETLPPQHKLSKARKALGKVCTDAGSRQPNVCMSTVGVLQYESGTENGRHRPPLQYSDPFMLTGSSFSSIAGFSRWVFITLS